MRLGRRITEVLNKHGIEDHNGIIAADIARAVSMHASLNPEGKMRRDKKYEADMKKESTQHG